MRSLSRMLPTLIILSTFAGLGPLAATSPEAQAWLEKMSGVYKGQSFKVDYTATMLNHQVGQNFTVEMKGALTHGDAKHQRMDIQMKMQIPGMAGAGIDIRVFAVADGETMWIESVNPMTGKQVMKIAVDDVEKLASNAPGAGLGMGAGSNAGLDPVGKIEALTRMFDFQVESDEDEHVTLRGTMTDAAASGLDRPEISEGLSALVLVLDKATAFPAQMTMGGAEPMMTMTFSKVEFFEMAEAAAETFAYAPAEGVQVIDLGQFADKAGAGQAGEGQ